MDNPPSPAWCTNCGAPMNGRRFCSSCGQDGMQASGGGPASGPAPDPSPMTVPVTPVQPPYVLLPNGPPGPPPALPPVAPPPYVPPSGTPPRRRTPLVVGAVVAAVVLLAAGGTGAYLLATSGPDDADTGARDRDRASTETSSTPDPTTASSTPPTHEAVPLRPVTLSDKTGDALLRGQGPETSSGGDLRQVQVLPQQDGEPGWVIVEFAGNASPPVGVIVRFDVDGDSTPDFVSWRHVTTGATGSGAVGGWGHGRDILDGSQADDARFSDDSSAAPRDGLAFPFRLGAGDSPRETIRVNVQMVSDAEYYDYAPGRHVWSPRVDIATQQ